MTTISQQLYIANWHDSFVNYIGCMLGVVAVLLAKPKATEVDKRALDDIKFILNGRDAADVEHDLATRGVKKSALDKIEKLNKDLADICLEYIQMNLLVRKFWRQMTHIKIERDKAGEQDRLAVLLISVVEG